MVWAQAPLPAPGAILTLTACCCQVTPACPPSGRVPRLPAGLSPLRPCGYFGGDSRFHTCLLVLNWCRPFSQGPLHMQGQVLIWSAPR